MKMNDGGEHAGEESQEWLSRQKIVHEVTTAYFPESNGAAEQLNRTLQHTTRTVLLAMRVQRKIL